MDKLDNNINFISTISFDQWYFSCSTTNLLREKVFEVINTQKPMVQVSNVQYTCKMLMAFSWCTRNNMRDTSRPFLTCLLLCAQQYLNTLNYQPNKTTNIRNCDNPTFKFLNISCTFVLQNYVFFQIAGHMDQSHGNNGNVALWCCLPSPPRDWSGLIFAISWSSFFQQHGGVNGFLGDLVETIGVNELFWNIS